ncbi:MAG: hypothetical protein ACYDDB_04520 [bacterium]
MNSVKIMKKKLFLHIGTHKTGTTALQSLLATNDRLLSNSGVLFPSAGRIGKYSGHHNIARELNDEVSFKEKYGTLERLCREIKKSKSKKFLQYRNYGKGYGAKRTGLFCQGRGTFVKIRLKSSFK